MSESDKQGKPGGQWEQVEPLHFVAISPTPSNAPVLGAEKLLQAMLTDPNYADSSGNPLPNTEYGALSVESDGQIVGYNVTVFRRQVEPTTA